MAETRNIVILGAGFAGMSAAHYFMKHIYPTLKKDAATTPYRLIIVDQSSQFWWHISAPRAMVASKLMPHNKTFWPLADGFKQYGNDKDAIAFLQAQPTSLDLEARTVTVKSVSAAHASAADNSPAHIETIPFYAVIVATGTRTPTPLTSFHGDHTLTIAALDAMNSRLNKATSIVISGGGPVGVETAGEIGEALNGSAGFMQSRPANAKVKITLVAGAKKLLPVLADSRAAKAAKMLEKVGVDVVYGSKVSNVQIPEHEDGKTKVQLDDGSALEADVYIPATGVSPNTEFLPKHMLSDKGYVAANAKTLRVDVAGERVYVIGDVGDYTRGGVMDVYAAAPVLGSNLAHDLGVSTTPIREFKGNVGETQLVPIGSKRGVGAFNGMGMPSMAVKMFKGKDYFLSSHEDITYGHKYAKA